MTEGLDALVLSPVFPAGGASAVKPALGVAEFGRWIQDVDLPVYALGGIRPDNVASLTGSGACGLAGVEAIQSAFRS
jgi:thiamine-phosphate pyrophosphorylase